MIIKNITFYLVNVNQSANNLTKFQQSTLLSDKVTVHADK